jgi:hypothetical protein
VGNGNRPEFAAAHRASTISWTGFTGGNFDQVRYSTSLNYSDADFEAVLQKFVLACQDMQRDGWWWHAPEITNKSIRRSILKETLFR